MATNRTSVNQAFGEVLRRYRLGASLSQEALAYESGIHVSYVSQLERGLKSPSLTTLFALAASLHVRADELVAETAVSAKEPDSF